MKHKANLIFVDCNKAGDYIFYFSRRSKNAKMFPDYYSFWGGGIEASESPKQAVVREIKEELHYTVRNPLYVGTYNTPGAIKHVYYLFVKKDLVDNLPILEGQYGMWFTLTEAEKEKKIIAADMNIIKELVGILD